MPQTSSKSMSSRRKMGVLTLLLAAVLNIMLPLVSVAPAQAKIGDTEASLPSNSSVICTPQGLQPLDTPTEPTTLVLDGHCVFCFAGLAFPMLPATSFANYQHPPIKDKAFGARSRQVIYTTLRTAPGAPRAPPLFI